jgi:multidrug transporter EmrE-like cation transporter
MSTTLMKSAQVESSFAKLILAFVGYFIRWESFSCTLTSLIMVVISLEEAWCSFSCFLQSLRLGNCIEIHWCEHCLCCKYTLARARGIPARNRTKWESQYTHSSLDDFLLCLDCQVWAALGTAIVSAAGIIIFEERFDNSKLAFLSMIVLGVVGLNLTDEH